MDTVVAIASSESQATFQRMDFSASAVASIASLTLSEVRGKDEQVEVQVRTCTPVNIYVAQVRTKML